MNTKLIKAVILSAWIGLYSQMFSVISSGQVAKHNLSSRNLIKQTHNSHSSGGSLKVGGVIAGSNATETSSFLKNCTIQSELRTKGNLSKSIQNAVSFVQTQQSKIEMLNDIYSIHSCSISFESNHHLIQNHRKSHVSSI